MRAAAELEATDEFGIDGLRVTPVPVHLDRHVLVGDFGRCREHLDIRYAAIAPPGAEPRVSGESLDVRWWSLDALPEGHVDELDGLVAAALRVLR